MRLEKHTGFVVYGFPLGEADQIVSCFTSEGNLVKFIAKGSRKIKSRFAASVQLFNLAEFVLYKSKGLPYLRQAAIIDSFAPVRRDWQKSGAAFAVAELCRLLIGRRRANRQFSDMCWHTCSTFDRDYVPLTLMPFAGSWRQRWVTACRPNAVRFAGRPRAAAAWIEPGAWSARVAVPAQVGLALMSVIWPCSAP